MRVFTIDEKKLLARIRDGKGRNLYSLIDPWIKGVSFHVNTQTNSVDFIFEVSSKLNLNDRLIEIQDMVIQSVNLIKLFEDKGYIFTYINVNQLPPNPFTFGQAAINLPSIPYHFPDPRISELFCEYSIKAIYVTPELNKFISDGYITREEYRANRQWNTTKAALGVTIFALLLNVCFNIININDRNSRYTQEENKESQGAIELTPVIKTNKTYLDTLKVAKQAIDIVIFNTDTIDK